MITEITGLDIAPGDRVYSSDSGYVVKVRTRDTPTGSPDRLAFVFTGSLCDENGRALPFEDGHFILAPHELSVRSDTTPNLADLIRAEHHAVVAQVERAAINRAAFEALNFA